MSDHIRVIDQSVIKNPPQLGRQNSAWPKISGLKQGAKAAQMEDEMAKIITSKSGKRYLVLDASELTVEEQRLVEASAAADKLAAAAAKAMRDAVLARQELQGHGFTQVYRSYGGGVKLLKGEVHEAKPKAESKSLADMLSEYDADGIAH